MALSPGFSDELLCSVCLETFNTPILLPCAHTFCKQCLLNVHERSRIRGTQRGQNLEMAGHSTNERPLVCPQCRIEITLGPEGINGLPKNTSLANIILSLEEVKKAKNIVCEVCDDDPARAASKTCADCAVTYCTPCFRELHPMRGAFKYHVIKEANVPIPRCTSPVFDNRLARFTPSRGDGYGTDGNESGDDSGSYGSQDCLEVIRKQIKSKRKELNSVSKTLQNVLKTTEEETEERMREIRSTCSQINEEVGEKEATLLTAVSQKRHEAVRQCLALSSEVKAQTLTLDLLEDQVNDIMALRAVHTGTDVSNDIECLKEKISAIQSRALTMKAKVIPRQAKLGNTELFKHISDLDFVKENTLLSPVLTEINLRPVSVGCAMAEVKWRPMDEVSKFRLSATKKDTRGIEVTTSVELSGSMTSYLLLLPEADAEYYVTLVATSEEGVNHPQVGRAIRTLPVVHCFRARFNPAACHKRMAVSSSRDEVVHRKCKVASLHNACAMTTSFYRLEHLEGTPTEDSLPLLPYVYWESVIHFHVFGKLGNSKLLCDIGVCKQGSEDSSSLLCDNSKAYCSYLVRRNNRVVLEFWNGPNRDILARSIPVVDLDQETEKTIKLGFYFDALRRVFAVVSPGNNSVLCQFQIKFPNLVPVCALYCFDHVYVMIKIPEPAKLPTVLSRLMRGGTPA